MDLENIIMWEEATMKASGYMVKRKVKVSLQHTAKLIRENGPTIPKWDSDNMIGKMEINTTGSSSLNLDREKEHIFGEMGKN